MDKHDLLSGVLIQCSFKVSSLPPPHWYTFTSFLIPMTPAGTSKMEPDLTQHRDTTGLLLLSLVMLSPKKTLFLCLPWELNDLTSQGTAAPPVHYQFPDRQILLESGVGSLLGCSNPAPNMPHTIQLTCLDCTLTVGPPSNPAPAVHSSTAQTFTHEVSSA